MSRSTPQSRRARKGSSTSNVPPFRRQPLFESLENRLLLSANPAVALAADGVLAVQGSDGADHAVLSHAGRHTRCGRFPRPPCHR